MSETLPVNPEAVAAHRIQTLCLELAVSPVIGMRSYPNQKENFYSVQGIVSIVPVKGIYFKRWGEDDMWSSIALRLTGGPNYTYRSTGERVAPKMPIFDVDARAAFIASALLTLDTIDELRSTGAIASPIS